MQNLTGKKFSISGMSIEVISDNGKQCETLNLTTRENISFDKQTLVNAIKLGKAEEITGENN